MWPIFVIHDKHYSVDVFPTDSVLNQSVTVLCVYTFQNKEEELFLKAVSLCHTVQISYDQTDGPGDPFSRANGFSPQMEYYASSPDEKALVEATKRWEHHSVTCYCDCFL